MAGPEPVQVECYAGHRADERPLAFRRRGMRVAVRAVLDTWHDPDHTCFRVVGEDGGHYLLRHHRRMEGWELVRAAGSAPPQGGRE